MELPHLGDRLIARRVSCQLGFIVTEPAEVVLQVVVSRSAGAVDEEGLDVRADGVPLSLVEIGDAHGATMHVVQAPTGRLSVSYKATVRVVGATVPPLSRDHLALGRPPPDFDRQVYLRPSRYCPSDHLIGFAVAEFGVGPDNGARVTAITRWIRRRIAYVPGSGSVHDSAEHTLLTGMGTCRDFAHLGIALCRATNVPARFAAVYAPGLTPMDFHAVFEAFVGDRWLVYDSTGLAPRQSLVRIATGRDAADTAFAAVNDGVAELDSVEVNAVAEPSLPIDDIDAGIELA